MKNIYFIVCLFFFSLSYSQINPVQNLEWFHTYEDMHNIFSLTWEEPEQPHDKLIGYNIYREDELYKFQTETSLGYHPDFGDGEDEEFINYNNGEGFTGYVAAVYAGNVESDYVSFEVGGVLLNILEIKKDEIQLYPNPAVDIIKFNHKLNNILLFDANGNQVKFIQKSVDALNISNLPEGVYLLKAETISGHSLERRFIKK